MYPPLGLNMAVKVCPCPPHPSLKAFIEALPQPQVRVCCQNWQPTHGPSAQDGGFLFPSLLDGSFASHGNITLLACFSFYPHLPSFSLFLQVISLVYCSSALSISMWISSFSKGIKWCLPYLPLKKVRVKWSTVWSPLKLVLPREREEQTKYCHHLSPFTTH